MVEATACHSFKDCRDDNVRSLWFIPRMIRDGELLLAIEKELWDKFQIDCISGQTLIETFTKLDSATFPKDIRDVSSFLAGPFLSYISPVPGIYRTKVYSREALEEKGIKLVPDSRGRGCFVDPGLGLSIIETEERGVSPKGSYYYLAYKVLAKNSGE
jgi:hypothetical protein